MEIKLIKEIKKISLIKKHEFHFLAKFIINNLLSIPKLSISDLSAKAFISISMINNFIKFLNLSDYNEFINLIDHYNEILITTNINLNQTTFCLNEIIKKNFINTINIIKETYKLIILQNISLNNSIDLVLSSNKIYIFAVGSTFNIAKDFSEKLLQIGFSVINANDFHSFYFLVNQASVNDLVIIMSYSGETMSLIKISEICHNKKIKIVTVTKDTKNSLLKYANEKIIISNSEFTNHVIAPNSRIALLFILDIIYLVLIERNYDKYYQILYSTKSIEI